MNTSNPQPEAEPVSQEFILSRTFDAPRELVFKAWTEPDRMQQWWGSKGTSVSIRKMDLHSGGTMHYCLHTAEGQEIWGKFVYCEIVPWENILAVNSFSDAEEGITRHPMSSTWPLEMLSTFTFEEHEGRTVLTIRWLPFSATKEECETFANSHEACKEGWTGTLDQLAEYLASTQSLDLSNTAHN